MDKSQIPYFTLVASDFFISTLLADHAMPTLAMDCQRGFLALLIFRDFLTSRSRFHSDSNHPRFRKWFVVVWSEAGSHTCFPMWVEEIPYNPMLSTYSMALKTTLCCLPAQDPPCPLNPQRTSSRDGQAGVKITDLIPVMEENLN